MVLALTTARELGLAAVAATLILFAVLSAFVLPARYPNFPGQRLGLFVVLTLLLFAAMLTAVLVIAREPKEKGARAAEPGTTQTQTGQTQTSQTQTGQTQTGGGVGGDPAVGKQVFASAGCVSCHTLKAAGSNGTVGPNLDEKKPAYDLIVERVTNGKSPMPSFKGQLSDEQIHDVAAFVYTSTH